MLPGLLSMLLIVTLSCTGQPVNEHAAEGETTASPSVAVDTSTANAATAENAGTQPVPESTSIHAPFDAMLKRHVRNERIDYLVIRRDDHEALDTYLDTLAGLDVDAMTEDAQLAYYINLYNAAMIRVIVHRLVDEYSVSENDYGVFDEPLVRLKTKTISLNQLEHEIIRPEFNDPRIHAALVCGAKSCPPLIPRAYRADDLDAVLTDNLQTWLTDPSRNVIDTRKRELRLSSIFDWYAEDFGGKGNLARFVNDHVPPQVSDFDVQFMPYSWDLNIAAPADGDWLTATKNMSTTVRNADGDRSSLRIRAGDIVESLGEQADGRTVTIRVPFTGETATMSADGFAPYNVDR